METALPTDAELLSRIERFCDDNAIAPTTFGRLAIGDGGLVTNLRANRSVTLKTANRIADFMSEYRPTASQSEAA